MNRYLQWPGIISTALVAACVLCLIVLGLETNWGREFRREATVESMRPAKAADAAILPAATLLPLDAGFPESGARPLFMPSRRAVPAAAPAPKMTRGLFVLVGTSRTKEFGDSAMLKEISTNKTSIVAVDATIRDMTVAEVGPDKVVLKLGDETEELVLKARPQARPAGTPPGAASPGAMPQIGQAAPAPGAGIFGGAPAPATATRPNTGPIPQPPASIGMPGAPGTPAVFPGAGSNIAPPNPPGTSQPGAQPRAPTPEEILERRRRARAQQQAQ
jgi:general secretion pathway protein N